MPLTDMADLMERMFTLPSAARPDPDASPTAGPDDPARSLTSPPMRELNAPVRGFAEVYGEDTRLLDQLGRDTAAAGAPELSALLSALEEGLRYGTLDLPPVNVPAPWLLRHVYPVI